MPKRRSACTPLACMYTYLPAQCVHCLPRARIIHPHYARGRVRARLPGWLAGWLTGWSAGQPFVRFPASMPVRCLREIRVSRFSPTVIDRSRSLTRSRRPDCERPRSQLMARPPIQLCTYNGEEEEWGVERKERRKKQISSITFHLSSM